MPSTLFPETSMLVPHVHTRQPGSLAALIHVNRRKACLTARGCPDTVLRPPAPSLASDLSIHAQLQARVS